MSTVTLRLLTLGLFICLYLAPLGVRPLMEPDETRYGEVPREMIASGDWITPRLNGLRYFEKPPLGYWLIGASILTFGENGFALRLPSALSVALSALLIVLLVRRAAPRDDGLPGTVAAFVFITCLEVAGLGTFSLLDPMLAAALTLTMVCLFLASEEESGSGRQRWLLVAAGVACGLAFLLKGFLALVVPALSMGAYLLWERRWRDLLGLSWLPLLAAVLTALPWSLAIHSQEPDFWKHFFWHEHVNRFLGGEEAQHQESFFTFVLAASGMFVPWTFALPAAGLGLRHDDPGGGGRRLIRFCLAWFSLPFLFFSLSSGKLLTYILPCFPPFAILVGLGLLARLRQGHDRAFRNGARAAALVAGLAALAFFLLQSAGLSWVTPPYPPQGRQWLLALAALLAMALLPLAASRPGDPLRRLVLLGLSPALLLGLAAFIMPPQAIEKRSPGALLLRHRPEITADTVILSAEDPLRAVCWFWQRDDVLLVKDGGELIYGLRYPEGQGRLLTLDETRAKIAANPGKTVLVARARNYRQWTDKLPVPRTIDASGIDGYILAQY